MNFKNQVIWITGASSGIGKSLAITEAAIILPTINVISEKLSAIK